MEFAELPSPGLKVTSVEGNNMCHSMERTHRLELLTVVYPKGQYLAHYYSCYT